MELRVHGTADEFLEAAGEALLRDEARHNAVLGVAHRVREGRRYGPEPPYFATVHEGGKVLVAALRTPPHPLLLAVLAPRPGAVERLADHLVAADPALPGVNGLLPPAADFAWHWVARRGARAEEEMRLRLYALREVIPPVGVPGELREPRAEERDLLASWIRAFQAEALPHEPPEDPHQVLGRFAGPHAWLRVWDRGGPVSMAAAFQVSPHGARVVLVYTPPERRRRGYASACVAALSRLLLDQGCSFCALYADLANPASNRVYQRIGYRPLGDAALYRFTAAERNRSPSSRNARRASASR